MQVCYHWGPQTSDWLGQRQLPWDAETSTAEDWLSAQNSRICWTKFWCYSRQKYKFLAHSRTQARLKVRDHSNSADLKRRSAWLAPWFNRYHMNWIPSCCVHLVLLTSLPKPDAKRAECLFKIRTNNAKFKRTYHKPVASQPSAFAITWATGTW